MSNKILRCRMISTIGKMRMLSHDDSVNDDQDNETVQHHACVFRSSGDSVTVKTTANVPH